MYAKVETTKPDKQETAHIQNAGAGNLTLPFQTTMPKARLDKEAPDFVAEGFYQNEFKEFQLSNYRGKWVVLCFYPADFTFV